MDIGPPSETTPPPNVRRSSSQYFTPPSASPLSTGTKVSAAVNFFESRSREGSPRLDPRPGPSRRASGASHVSQLEEVLSDEVGSVRGSGGRARGSVSSREGSPTPVKGSGAKMLGAETTPTRPAPRMSLSGSRIPNSGTSSPSRLAPRATPPVSGGSIPPPRSVSYSQGGPSRIPRPVRRVSVATGQPSSIPNSGPSTPPRQSPVPPPRSKIPVLTPRRRPREPDADTSPRSSQAESTISALAAAGAENTQITPPRDPQTPLLGSRRTSYRLSPTSPSSSHTRTRRPSSGSLNSPGRRPSGPRKPSHSSRTSISSLSSLLSDEVPKKANDGRESSLSGRSSHSISEVEEKARSRPPSANPPSPSRPLTVDIPPRSTSTNEGNLLTARPPITPRRSSREPSDDLSSTTGSPVDSISSPRPSEDNAGSLPPAQPPARPPIDAKRRASKAVVLGEVAMPSRVRPRADNSDFMPGPSMSQKPSIVGRRGSQVNYEGLPSSSSEPDSPALTGPAGATLPRSSPRSDKNRQGLVVDTAATSRPAPTESPLRQMTPLSSPPIPVKNPMRQRSRPESAASSRRGASESVNGDSPITRTPSVYLDSPAEETDDGASPSGREAGRMPTSAGAKDDRYSTDSRRSRGSTEKAAGDSGWGGKRRGRIMAPGEMEALMQAADREVAKRMSSAASTNTINTKPLPEAPSDYVESAVPITTTTATPSPIPSPALEPEPHTPELPRHHPPTKSPSLPMLGHGSPPTKSSRLLGVGNSPSIQSQMRSGTDPMAAQNRLLPPPMLRSPTSPNITSNGPASATAQLGLRPPSVVLSKRSHLLREIAMTERAFANDLALLRDAFIGRAAQRRPSTHSIAESFAGGGVSPGAESMRGSLQASQSMDSRRTSEYSNNSTLATVPPPSSPLPKSPSAGEMVGMTSFFGSTASLSPLPHFSPRTSSIGMSMAAPIGKSISPTDIRAIFLNIDQLASASEDLAADFERAIGEEEAGPGVSAREGEGGTDKLGEVFVSHLPRIRPLYTFYCARQSTASVRLMEIQADPSHASYLKDRWEQIKAHTHAWNLDSMLIKPVQRITKYPLLFDDLLACTTPVHPDYFSIRSAAEQCRVMAQEIDEAKRRKDLVAGVISNKPGGNGGGTIREAKTPSRKVGGGLKLFRNKEKSGTGSTISLANTLAGSSSVSLAPGLSGASTGSTATLVPSPSDIMGGLVPQASFLEYRILVEKLEDAERMVRRVGREVVVYTAAAKEVFVAQMALTTGWERVVGLDGTAAPDKRLKAFKQVGEGLVDGCWAELNQEVKSQIMPALSKLLDCSGNPRKVIQKRDAKAADYARITQQKDRQRTQDRAVVDSAREFVALHTQLLEELPPFLEGYIRIFDLTVAAFSRAQAKYHSTVSRKLDLFMKRWITASKVNPRSPTSVHSRNTIELNDDFDTPPADLAVWQEIVSKWETSWTPYSNALDHLRIARAPTTRTMADRMADYSDRTGARGHVRTPSSRSGNASPTGSIGRSGPRPDLKHSNSFTSTRRPAGDSGRLISPAGSIRRSGVAQDGGRSRSASLLSPTADAFKGYRTTSAGLADPRDRSDAASVDSRLSFGLPRISPSDEKAFVDLGFGSRSRASSVGVDALGLGSPSTPTGTGPGFAHGSVAVVPPTPPMETGARVVSNAESMARRSGVLEDDAGEGWRNERVLYQCAVVADFDPSVFGSRRYRKLRFLPVSTGDLIDLFYEVGRIDELPAFPYPEIGVENDGLLVGRKEDGDIGLVICSFLEPIT